MSSLIVEAVKIKEIIEHGNADKLEVAVVKGWNVIIQKGQYQTGDLVVFIPPDSILPQDLIEKYELTYMKNGERIRTVKLRGVISQGLILPLPVGKYREGDDLSSILGITKWQPPEPSYSVGDQNQTSKSKLNPLFDKYTEIENIKNYDEVFAPGDIVVITEKIHGTNFRAGNLEISILRELPILEKIVGIFQKYVLRKTHQFCYGSHNRQITSFSNTQNFYGDDLWGRMCKKYNLRKLIPKGMIIYGEAAGGNIQDLTYGLKEADLFVFDIKQDGQYLSFGKMVAFCTVYGLQTVPTLYIGAYYDGILEDYTKGQSVICPGQMREGIVIKMFEEKNHKKIGRMILKSVSTEYLNRKNATEYK